MSMRSAGLNIEESHYSFILITLPFLTILSNHSNGTALHNVNQLQSAPMQCSHVKGNGRWGREESHFRGSAEGTAVGDLNQPTDQPTQLARSFINFSAEFPLHRRGDLDHRLKFHPSSSSSFFQIYSTELLRSLRNVPSPPFNTCSARGFYDSDDELHEVQEGLPQL